MAQASLHKAGNNMKWKAHLFIGISFGAIASLLLGLSLLPDAFLFCAISGAASLLPDLDIRNSKASQASYVVAFFAVVLLSYQNSIAKGGSLGDFASSFTVISALLLAADALFRPRHRGAMHGVPFAFAAALVCYIALGMFPAAAFLLGYCSHLMADGVFH
jgi:membrane-bound metal-dependent hydrolase YbcI (DUF457 family)